MKPYEITTYQLETEKSVSFTAAVLSDLHDNQDIRYLMELEKQRPDYVFIPGDVTESLETPRIVPPVFEFLRQIASIAPTYYIPGNHEGFPCREMIEKLLELGLHYVSNNAEFIGDIVVFGAPYHQKIALPSFPASFFTILLCHDPKEATLLRDSSNYDLILSGHAHGGHWVIGGKPIYAPGQGFFPSLTSGHHGNLIISRGLGDHTRIPRIGNLHELVWLFVNR